LTEFVLIKGALYEDLHKILKVTPCIMPVVLLLVKTALTYVSYLDFYFFSIMMRSKVNFLISEKRSTNF
jgi:hypothetical protein